MRKFLWLLSLFLIWEAGAATSTRVTALLTITNTPVTSNTFTVNTSTRTWHTNITVPASQISVTTNTARSTTNLHTQISVYPIAGVTAAYVSSNSLYLYAAVGTNLSVTALDWGSVTYSTSIVYQTYTVTVPYDSVTNLPARTNIASGLANWLSLVSTQQIPASAPAFSNFVGITGDQAIGGAKVFTNSIAGTLVGLTNGILEGQRATNLTGLSGTVSGLTNGYYDAPTMGSPVMTNAQNYGNAISSPGTGANAEQFGTGATATGDYSLAVGDTAEATKHSSVAIGYHATGHGEWAVAIGAEASATSGAGIALGRKSLADGSNSFVFGSYSDTSLGHDNSVVLGNESSSTAANQILLGNSAHTTVIPGALSAAYQTNSTLAGTNRVIGDWAWNAHTISTIANGVNTVDPASYTFLTFSGSPTLAFSIAGIEGGKDGRFLVIDNATGQNMSVLHNSGLDPVAENRIYVPGSADVTFNGRSSFLFLYNGTASRWLLVSPNPLGTNATISSGGTDYVTNNNGAATNLLLYYSTPGLALEYDQDRFNFLLPILNTNDTVPITWAGDIIGTNKVTALGGFYGDGNALTNLDLTAATNHVQAATNDVVHQGNVATNLTFYSTNGYSPALVVNSNLTVRGQVLGKIFGDYATRPSFAFETATNTGWAGATAGQIEGVLNGTRYFTLSVGGIATYNAANSLNLNDTAYLNSPAAGIFAQFGSTDQSRATTNRQYSYYTSTNYQFFEKGFDIRSNAFVLRLDAWTNGAAANTTFPTNYPLQLIVARTNLGLTIATNGVVTFGQPLWQDVSAPLAALSSPSAQPGTETWVGGIKQYAFDAASDEELHGALQVPHGVITNDAWGLRLHVHFSGLTTPTETSNVVWGLEYVLASPTDAYAGSATTIYATNGISAVRKHVMASFPTITGFRESAVLTYRLFRDADNAADTYGGDAFGFSLDAHVPMIRLGSQNETGDY